MDKYTLKLEMPAIIDSVPSVRTLISDALLNFQYPDKEAFRVELIVDELLNNAIIYGSTKLTDKVNLNIKISDKEVEVQVEDKGKNNFHKERLKHLYDKLKINNITENKGLSLIKLIADEFNVKFNDSGETQIHAVKYREKKD